MSSARGVQRMDEVSVTKRDGGREPWAQHKIERAIALACRDINVWTADPIEVLAEEVAENLSPPCRPGVVGVEAIQDQVERVLLAHGAVEVARHYMRYRDAHERLRAERPVAADVRAAFEESAGYFPSALQQYQFYSKYSRYNAAKGRRETWPETVDRALDFLQELASTAPVLDWNTVLTAVDWPALRRAVLQMQVMPSMRLLAMAGPAARRNHLALYNCSYLPVSDADAFVEALLLSMAGCGVGYSVERQHVERFARVRRQTGRVQPTFVIGDTTEGWAEALRFGVLSWLEGDDAVFDYGRIRPAGAILQTKGGRASGPEPLKKMLDRVRAVILARQGMFLRPLDAHDIMCLIGSAVVSGGVRRTAMICLFDADDTEVARCKDGNMAGLEHRYNANNSAVLPERRLTQAEVMALFSAMDAGQRGEPGLFSRAAIERTKPARRKSAEWGVNPCAEIALRPYGLCNLSVCVARPDDTQADLEQKVRLAVQLGALQSLATHFPGLRPQWKRNAEEERLLGVDITGQMDTGLLNGREGAAYTAALLTHLKAVAVAEAERMAGLLGINVPAAVTTVKPSGNSSVLLDCSNGIHARHAPYYIRRVREAATSPLLQVLRDAGVPLHPEVGQAAASATTWVAEFVVAAPAGARTGDAMPALDQLRQWALNKRYWAEHNVSATIRYRPDELLDVVRWVWQQQDLLGGLSFLPHDGGRYELAPLEAIAEEEYQRLAVAFPALDFSKLLRYEASDQSEAAQTVACTSDLCELPH